MKTKKLVAICLIIATAVSICSCVINNGGNESSATSDASSIADFSDTSSNSIPDLDEIWADFPNEYRNWGKTDITLLGYVGEMTYDTCQIATDSKSGKAVNDAVYDRNYQIAKDFGVRITVLVPYNNNSISEVVRAANLSGTNEFQGVVAPMNYLTSMAFDDLFYDLGSLDNQYLNLSNPWWDQQLTKNIAINNKYYFATGGALLADDESTYVIYCNEEMYYNNLDIAAFGPIYNIVSNGKWTLDLMYTMMQMLESPTKVQNMNATSPYIWGLVGQSKDFALFMESFNCDLAQLSYDANKNKAPVLRLYSRENGEAFENLSRVFLDKTYTAITNHYNVDAKEKRSVFTAGKALFMAEQIGFIETDLFKYSNIKMGVLPMPKLDEKQEGYHSTVSATECAAIAIPLTCKGDDLDKTCYALEAMGFLGQKNVDAVYHENQRKTLSKLSQYPERANEMLDLIFANKHYDIAAIYNFNAGDESKGIRYFYESIINTKTDNLTNEYTKMKGIYQQGIDVIVNKCYYDSDISGPILAPIENYTPPEPLPKPEKESVLISSGMEYKYPTNINGTYGARGYIGNLTDGVVPDVIHPYVEMDNSRWFGIFRNHEAPNEENAPYGYGSFVFDFKTERNITDVKVWIGSIEYEMYHVYVPASITVETSRDGSYWSTAQVLDLNNGEPLFWATANLNELAARYVRITVNLSDETWSYWAFIGEIEIYARAND